MKFPGDACDPFEDWCVDGYECEMLASGSVSFTCQERTTDFPEHDGEYLSHCNPGALNLICQTGLTCWNDTVFPEGACTEGFCCIEVCAYGDTCSNGNACTVMWWQEILAEHLQGYNGIGICQ